MASSKDYMDFILEQLSELDEITYRARDWVLSEEAYLLYESPEI